MRMRSCLGLFLILSFLQVHAQKISFSEKRSTFYNYVKGDDFEGVVFSQDFVFPFLSNQSGDRRFTPSNTDIEAAEKLLTTNIKSINTREADKIGRAAKLL